MTMPDERTSAVIRTRQFLSELAYTKDSRVAEEIRFRAKLFRGTTPMNETHVKRYGIRDWLALDDNRAGFDGYKSHLIHCQQGVGLRDKDVQNFFCSQARVDVRLTGFRCRPGDLVVGASDMRATRKRLRVSRVARETG